jgi:hypothetical protein
VVQEDILDMRKQMASQRDKVVDRDWAYRQATARAVIKSQELPPA